MNDLELAMAVDRIDAAIPRMNKALIGLTCGDVALLCGAFLGVAVRACTDDSEQQDDLIREVAAEGFRYLAIDHDVKSWIAAMRDSTR